MNIEIANRLCKLRKEHNLSQEQLAEILCTKKATISAYENDHIDIKSSIVLEIAKALNCSGSYLLEGKKAEALEAGERRSGTSRQSDIPQ